MGRIATKFDIAKCNIQYIVNTSNKIKKKAGPKFKLTKSNKRHIQSEISEANKENKKCSSKIYHYKTKFKCQPIDCL